MPKKIHLPKTQFKISSIKDEVNLIKCFYKDKNFTDAPKYLFKKHPRLGERLNIDKNDNHTIISRYVSKYYYENRSEIKSNLRKYQNEWLEIEKDLLKLLSEIMQIRWPSKRTNITAYLTISPVFPRDLKNWSFRVPDNNITYMKMVATLGIIHLLYFEKWKKIFPTTPTSHFECPYPEWMLSEIITPIIINETPGIQKLIHYRDLGYEIFKNIKINQLDLLTHFGIFYKEFLEQKYSFSFYLKKSWQEFKKYRNIINFT